MDAQRGSPQKCDPPDVVRRGGAVHVPFYFRVVSRRRCQTGTDGRGGGAVGVMFQTVTRTCEWGV